MAKPIVGVPSTAQAHDLVKEEASAQENLEAILAALQDAGVLRFVRALLEQRQPIAQKVITKLDTDPTKTGLKNAVTLLMGLGALPDGFGVTMMEAVQAGLSDADAASHQHDADKMSVWALMGMLKNPNVARSIHYLMGFLNGLGKALGDLPSEREP